MINKIND